VVLVGGDFQDTNYYNDTWTWDRANWTQQFPATTPTERSRPAMAYDGCLGMIVMAGGIESLSKGILLNDTRAWKGTNWKQLNPLGDTWLFKVVPARN